MSVEEAKVPTKKTGEIVVVAVAVPGRRIGAAVVARAERGRGRDEVGVVIVVPLEFQWRMVKGRQWQNRTKIISCGLRRNPLDLDRLH